MSVIVFLLDLPMRDGNTGLAMSLNWSPRPFRPSYEGWKHAQRRVGYAAPGLLLDLPMRDGNAFGMKEKRLALRLLDLPMRDGNLAPYHCSQ